MYQKKYHIFFVGIGGIGMSGIAELLLNLGYKVSGSDLKLSPITDRLKKLGVNIFAGHSKENIKDIDVVVTSTAVPRENPEICTAKERGVPVIPRAQMLAELMRFKYGIAVAGAHGKTSTTSIVAAILNHGKLDPTVVIGGILKNSETNSLHGQGNFMVVEADESDGSFLKLFPTIAIVTNIDREHLDYYSGIDEIKKAFLDFINLVPFYGTAIICTDNKYINELLPNIKERYITYGTNKNADLYAKNITFKNDSGTFDLDLKGKNLGTITINLPGMHSILNAMAAIATGLELEIPFNTIKFALKKITGVKRRLELKGEINNIKIMDDYGHHPTEIITTIKVAKQSWPNRRLIIAFQPHRFTRTQALFNEFSTAFINSDYLIILPVYSAGETPIKGINSETLLDSIKKNGHNNAVYINSKKEAKTYLKEQLKENDLLITMGAGDVYKLGEELLLENGKLKIEN